MYLNDCSSMEHQTIARNQSAIHICRCLCYHLVSALRGCVILADLQVLELHNHSRVAYFRSHHWVVNRSVLHWVNYCTILNQSSSCRSPYVPYLYEIMHVCELCMRVWWPVWVHCSMFRFLYMAKMNWGSDFTLNSEISKVIIFKVGKIKVKNWNRQISACVFTYGKKYRPKANKWKTTQAYFKGIKVNLGGNSHSSGIALALSRSETATTKQDESIVRDVLPIKTSPAFLSPNRFIFKIIPLRLSGEDIKHLFFLKSCTTYAEK